VHDNLEDGLYVELTDDVFEREPEPNPRHVHGPDVVWRDALVDASKDAPPDDGHGDGEGHEGEEA